MRRIVIGVEYKGNDFHGWQRQKKPEIPTVQLMLEQALSKIADHPVNLTCAGRTDAGVHATGQVAHFDVNCIRDKKAWLCGTNSLLPRTIRVRWVEFCDEKFHARHSALSRRYQYWIDNSQVPSSIFSGLLTHYKKSLDYKLMHYSAQCLVGEHDFTSFRGSSCESNTPMRNVHYVKVFNQAEKICIEIQANAFLLHMVRNIAGSLIEVGAKRKPCEWIADLLGKKNRNYAAPTAPPDGLYLVWVEYPKLNRNDAPKNLFYF
jgi:tRNA pseudouridine38-40 synthase